MSYGGNQDEGQDGGQDEGGAYMPTGTYRGRAVEWALAETNDGKEQIAVLFEFLDEAHVGKRMTWYGSFSDTQLRDGRTVAEMTLDALRTMGWQGDDVSNIAALPDEVSLVVGQDTYNGVSKSKIKFVNGKAGLAIKAPMPVDKAKAFAARMKGLAVKSRQQGSAPAAARAPQQQSRGQQQPQRGGQQQGRGGQQPQRQQNDRHPNAPGNDEDIPQFDENGNPLAF